jgi:preprotein translocase subunit SecG
MTVLYYFVLILHLIACFFLIAVVLLQQGKGQDLASAFGGGGTQAAFGPRGSATLLSRVTTGLAAVFMITSISLAVLKEKEISVLDKIPAATGSPTPAAAPTDVLGAPLTPAASPSPATSGAAPAAPPAASVAPSASPAPSVAASPAPVKPAASPTPKK